MKKSLKAGKAASVVVVMNKDLEVIALDHLCNRYIAVACVRATGCKPIVLISAYFKFGIATYIHPRELRNALGPIDEVVVIGADVNAHSPGWHQYSTNRTAKVNDR